MGQSIPIAKQLMSSVSYKFIKIDLKIKKKQYEELQ